MYGKYIVTGGFELVDYITNVRKCKHNKNIANHMILQPAIFGGPGSFADRFSPLKVRDSTHHSNSIFLKGKLKT